MGRAWSRVWYAFGPWERVLIPRDLPQLSALLCYERPEDNALFLRVAWGLGHNTIYGICVKINTFNNPILVLKLFFFPPSSKMKQEK